MALVRKRVYSQGLTIESGMGKKELQKILSAGEGRIGAASQQVNHFVNRAKKWGDKYPEAKEYCPPSIL